MNVQYLMRRNGENSKRQRLRKLLTKSIHEQNGSRVAKCQGKSACGFECKQWFQCIRGFNIRLNLFSFCVVFHITLSYISVVQCFCQVEFLIFRLLMQTGDIFLYLIHFEDSNAVFPQKLCALNIQKCSIKSNRSKMKESLPRIV